MAESDWVGEGEYEDADLVERRYVSDDLAAKIVTYFRAFPCGAVYTAEDVVLAIDHGVDGVIVSNHGGRQLDTVTATLEALPECIEAAAGRIPVHVDSGFRRGTDIFKVSLVAAVSCESPLTSLRPLRLLPLVRLTSGLGVQHSGVWR